jgi:hypothetical protein
MRGFHAILTALLVLFVAVMVIFRIIDGSFQSAGARVDRMLGAAATEVSQAADEAVQATESAVQEAAEDIANRRDDN